LTLDGETLPVVRLRGERDISHGQSGERDEQRSD
jgi:hypothetical protein